MTSRPGKWRRRLFAVFVVSGMSLLLAFVQIRTIGARHDFAAFFSGAVAISEGVSPYDLDARWRIQKSLVPSSQYLQPPYYPPWTYQACLPLVWFDYKTAQAVWIVVSSLAAILSGMLMGRILSRSLVECCLFTTMFLPTALAINLGQFDALMLLCIALTWDQLEAKRWWLAGAIAILTASKPHLGGPIIAVLLLWAICHRRVGLIWGAVASVSCLSLIGVAADRQWPLRMADAIFNSPVPTVEQPELGVTLLMVLRSTQLEPELARIAWLVAIAVTSAGVLLMIFLGRPVSRLMGLATIIVFVVSPYAMLYDLCLLCPAILAVRWGRFRLLWLSALVIVPYLQVAMLSVHHGFSQQSLFWIPLSILIAFTVVPSCRRSSELQKTAW